RWWREYSGSKDVPRRSRRIELGPCPAADAPLEQIDDGDDDRAGDDGGELVPVEEGNAAERGLQAVIERHVDHEQEGDDEQEARPIARQALRCSFPGHWRIPSPLPRTGATLLKAAGKRDGLFLGCQQAKACESLGKRPLFV